jgi:hypothetical protein
MKKILSALSLVLLLTVNTLANTSTTEPPAIDLSTIIDTVVVVAIAIAIPNLLK